MTLADETIVVSRLSGIQRRLLIKHIEGPQPIERTGTHGVPTVDVLLRSGYLRPYPNGVIRPRFTDLTESGRRIVARILSEYAEALISAGCLEIDPTLPSEARPIKMLSRLKTRRSARIRGLGKIAEGGENNPHEAVDNP